MKTRQITGTPSEILVEQLVASGVNMSFIIRDLEKPYFLMLYMGIQIFMEYWLYMRGVLRRWRVDIPKFIMIPP